MKSTLSNSTSFIFVDAHLEDIQTLSMQFAHGSKVYLLNNDENLLFQIATQLDGQSNIAALHIITHGRSGEILLGKNGVSLETLPLYGKELLAISSAMSESGELFLYGCEVASGERGAAFVGMLQDITGLKIAAATHKVGHEELGGSWELDVVSDVMTAQALHVSEWRGVLVEPDTTSPRLINIASTGSTVTLTYDEPLADTNVPGADMYVVKVNGAAVDLHTTTPVAVSGSTVTLTLESALQAGNKVLVSYSDPTMNGTWIKDASGNNNFADFFNDLAVAPLGGIAAEGNLKVTVLSDGAIVIDRFDGTNWNTQFYDNDGEQTDGLYSAGVATGAVLEINGKTLALNDFTCFESEFINQIDTPIISKSDNTITTTYTITAEQMETYFDLTDATGDLTIAQTVTLANNTDQKINISWAVTNSTGLELTDIRFAYLVDSYLAGGDSGQGVWIESQNTVGVQKLTTEGIQQMLLTSTGTITPADAESRYYDDVIAAATSEGTGGLSTTGNIDTDAVDILPDDEIDPITEDDNGYGMEWIIPTLAIGATATIAATESFVASSVLTEWTDDAAPVGAAGASIELTFEVSNVSGVEKTSNYTVEVPDGWSAAVLSVSSHIFGAESNDEGTTHDEMIDTATVTVKVTPPSGTTAGNYDVILKSTVGTTTTQTIGTVSVEAPAATPYISGKEKMVIGEYDNGALAISGFTLGNANNANDTTTELTVSIAAAHGTLTLGNAAGMTFTTGNNGGTDTTLVFKGTIADLRAAINTLSYDPEDSNTADDPLEIKISADDGSTWQPYTVDVEGKFYYAPNGHYYEYIEDNGITWDDAKAAAEAKTLYGLNGYLVTVTSQAENGYIAPKLGGDGWMGASDAASEGVWKWVTGPEAGTHFYNGYTGAGTDSYNEDTDGYGTTVNIAENGNYENWADGEPNNADDNGGEDVAHFYSESGDGDWEAGEWNDYHNENWDIEGYIVEYGGTGFGTLTAANLTIVTNLKPVLSNVVAGPIAAGTESDLQTTPLRLDTDVTLVEDSHTMNWTGEYDNNDIPIAGRIDVEFIDADGNNIFSPNNKISVVSNGNITVESDGDILYSGNYIGQTSGGINGNFRVYFDTKDTITATMVEQVIESITYTVNDAPVEATKLRYTVTDNTGLSSDPVDLVVNVTAQNDAPTLTTSTGLIRSNITPDSGDDAKSVVTLSDGSIIIAGDTDGTIKLAKYDANGALVSTFGTGGIVETALSGDFYSPNIALDSDGKIVLVAADDDSGNIVAMRYSSTGTLDTTFAADSDNIAVLAEYGYYPKVAVMSDNSIAVSFIGETYYEVWDEDVDAGVVAKLTSSGVLDTNFGNGGIQQITTPGSYTNEINDIMVSGDNILVTGGDSVYDSDTDDTTDNVYLATLNGSTGALSVTTTAAQSGDVWRDLDSTVEGSAIGKQSDGKIIVAGTADEDGVILARYNTNGTLDTTFGTDGKAAFTMFDEAQDIAIDSNNKIVVLNDGGLEVARILANGSALDATFGTDGVATINGAFSPWGAELKIATDGTIWVVGGDDDGDDGAFNIAKLSADGVPDANFISKATYTVSGEAVALDGAISVYDGELSDSQNQDGFNGATLTIARDGGANANDVFSAATESYLTFDSSDVVYDGTTVGTFTQAGGTLTITFNGNAHDGNINDIMRSIAYENTDETIVEATTVDLQWTFNDGTTVAQGTGGALSDTLVQTVNIAIPEPTDETAPEITSTPVTTVDEGAQYSYTLSATDETDVTWSVADDETLPEWLTLGKGEAAVTIADDFTDPGGMAYDDETGDIYAVYNSYIAGMFAEGEAPQTAIYKIAEDGTKTLFTNTEFGQVGSMVIYNGYLYAGFVHDPMIGVGSNLLMRYNLSDTDGSVTPEVVLQYGDNTAANYYEGEIITGLVEKDGFMYAVDYTNSKILKFNLSDLSADPTIHVNLSATAPYPYGIAFDSDGNLYGTSFGDLEREGEMPPSVFKYDGTDVSVVMSIDGAGEQVLHGIPTDIKIDAEGNFYISHLVMFPGNVSGIYKYNSDFEEQEPISTTANTWSMLFNSEGKIIAGDVKIDMANGTVSGDIFGIDTANYSLTGTAPSVDADTPSEITLVATDEAGNETEHTFTITVNDVPEVTNSVTLNVANPFTPNVADDTTAITIEAPDGISITGATNSAVSGLPKNVKMPLGQFGFTLSGLENGATVEMSMTADADFKQFSYFKKNLVTNKWVNIMEGVTINDNGTPNDASDDTATVKFSLTDGGVYDADRIANGVIVDPGGVGENALLPMIAENTTEVGTISLLDNTLASGTLSYAITGGADAAKFTVNASTGLLSFKSAPNYEAPTDAGDTENNNTYAVQVTVTGSTSGSEVQNLIVSILNVADNGDNANTAPIIVGLRAEAQAVTVGTSAALDDIRVVDANGDTMTITLTAVNGTIGGLTDAEADTAGIQLTGMAAAINTALAGATFTASSAGAASVNLSVTDTIADGEEGTAITTTSTYNLSASAAATPPSSGGGGGGSFTPLPVIPTIPSVTTTVDGATVQTATVTETRTTTDTSGNTTTTTVSTEQLIIAPVSGTRTDSTGTATTADVPLFWGESSRTEWATTANLPTGVGLTTAGSRAPESTATQQSALDDLLFYIDTTTPSSDLGKAEMLSGGATFLSALANIQTLVVNQITLSTTNTEASQVPITITGVANTVVTTDGAIAPVEALVIDAQSLQAGSMLNLQNVEFAVIIGENLTIRGGEGQNILFTGAGSQNIMLGEDDDQLYAGDGDDIVGSAGGDDSIFGEGGDDTVFGGEGNDMLHGGSEEDVATYSGNMADYVITRDEGKTYVALASNPNEVDTLINVENIEFADSSYTIENSITLSKIATLYMHILDRQAEIDGFQYWAKDTTGLGNIALGFITSVEYKTNSGVNWETLDVSGKVEQFYEALLGRSSDEVGKAYWVDAINAGMTFEQAVEGFIDSVELSGIYQSKEEWSFSL